MNYYDQKDNIKLITIDYVNDSQPEEQFKEHIEIKPDVVGYKITRYADGDSFETSWVYKSSGEEFRKRHHKLAKEVLHLCTDCNSKDTDGRLPIIITVYFEPDIIKRMVFYDENKGVMYTLISLRDLVPPLEKSQRLSNHINNRGANAKKNYGNSRLAVLLIAKAITSSKFDNLPNRKEIICNTK